MLKLVTITRDITCRRTVAGYDEELIVFCDIVYRDIGKSGHNLLLRRKIRALLEFEVANGSTERKVAIDSAEINKATGCTYTCFLALILWFVIE